MAREEISDFVADYAKGLVVAGIPKTEALAVACWIRHGIDRAKFERKLHERASNFEHAAVLARDYAFSRAALDGLDASGGQRRKDLPNFNDLANRIEKRIGKPMALAYGGETMELDHAAETRALLDRARKTHAEGWGSVALHMWELGLDLQRRAWRIHSEIEPSSRPRGRPRADHIKRLCKRASEAGLTPSQLANAAFAYPECARWLGLESKGRGKDPGGDPVDKLRQRLQQHWPARGVKIRAKQI